MYIGVGPETGKKVSEEDAFMYAMERCTTDYAKMFSNTFKAINVMDVSSVGRFREDVVEWFYSGNWLWKEN